MVAGRLGPWVVGVGMMGPWVVESGVPRLVGIGVPRLVVGVPRLGVAWKPGMVAGCTPWLLDGGWGTGGGWGMGGQPSGN